MHVKLDILIHINMVRVRRGGAGAAGRAALSIDDTRSQGTERRYIRLCTYTTNQNAARPRERERSVSDPVCRDRRETPRELPLNSGEGRRPSSRRGGRRHASDPGSVLFRARDTHAGQGRKQSEWSRRQGGERGTPLCGHIERCAASRLESKAAHDQEADKGGK